MGIIKHIDKYKTNKTVNREYIDITTPAKEFYEVLKNKIKNDEPLSLTRFGDGEIMFFDDRLSAGAKGKLQLNWKINKSNYPKYFNIILNMLKVSLKETDYIGLLDKDSYMGHIWAWHWTMRKETLKEVGRTKDVLVCDHQIARDKVLGNPMMMKEILNGKDLHLITPRKVNLERKKINEVLGCNVTYTEVPFTCTLEYRDKLLNDINNIKENVVFVGLAVLGKDIPHILSSRGKVCLDMGATLDAWGGLVTRPSFTTIHKHCLL